VPFVGTLVLVPVVFALLLVFFRHTLIPLMVLAAFAALAWFSLIIAGARLQRRYGGIP
jgi:hypothetical protein